MDMMDETQRATLRRSALGNSTLAGQSCRPCARKKKVSDMQSGFRNNLIARCGLTVVVVFPHAIPISPYGRSFMYGVIRTQFVRRHRISEAKTTNKWTRCAICGLQHVVCCVCRDLWSVACCMGISFHFSEVVRLDRASFRGGWVL